MIKTVVQIEDADKVYNIGDTVRIKMKPRYKDRYPSEYIGDIIDIKRNLIVLHIKNLKETLEIDVTKIDKMRLARADEDFINTFDF